jgi:hypothetical protein
MKKKYVLMTRCKKKGKSCAIDKRKELKPLSGGV